MPEPVERYDPDGIDHAWIMQTTFVVTIVVGAPAVAIASWTFALPTWHARVRFAVAIGAVIWFCVAVAVYGYAQTRLE